MIRPWLGLTAIGALGVVTLGFFAVRALPPSQEKPDDTSTALNITAPSVTVVNPAIGPANASLTIVLFSDFGCPECKTQADALAQLRVKYPQDVRVVWKDAPNTQSHPQAMNAAIAAHCAQMQGKFWEYHDALFLQQSLLSDGSYLTTAQALQLDESRFTSCYNAKETQGIVQRDLDEAKALNLLGTPTLYLNGARENGVVPLSSLETYVTKSRTK